MRFWVGASGAPGGVTVTNAYSGGTPTHIACTLKDGLVRVYINGVLRGGPTAVTGTPDELDTSLRFGIPSSQSVRAKFNGTADKMRIYD